MFTEETVRAEIRKWEAIEDAAREQSIQTSLRPERTEAGKRERDRDAQREHIRAEWAAGAVRGLSELLAFADREVAR